MHQEDEEDPVAEIVRRHESTMEKFTDGFITFCIYSLVAVFVILMILFVLQLKYLQLK